MSVTVQDKIVDIVRKELDSYHIEGSGKTNSISALLLRDNPIISVEVESDLINFGDVQQIYEDLLFSINISVLQSFSILVINGESRLNYAFNHSLNKWQVTDMVVGETTYYVWKVFKYEAQK